MAILQGPLNRGDGIVPAIALVDPKYPHNVGAAFRAASCYTPFDESDSMLDEVGITWGR